MTAAGASREDGLRRDALERLDARAASMVEQVRAWSAVNSGSAELANLKRMADDLCGAFAQLPGELERLRLAPLEHVRADGESEFRQQAEAIRVRVRPEAPIQVALTGHYDTVFPSASPFQSTRLLDADRLNGPGVADMKGGLIVMLEALLAFEQRAAARELVGYTVLISPDEETGSLASAPLLAEIGARAHVGLTYEPALADGSLAGARKGSGNFSLIVRGRSAHVGRAFQEGRNAIIGAARFAAALDALNGRREGVTFNVGAIEGGGPANVVPDRAVARFNIRADEPEAMAWAREESERLARSVAGDGLTARLSGAITRPPKPMTASLAALLNWTREAGAELGLELTWAPTGGVCEGNNLAAAGCPNVDTLGVRGGDIHSEQEFALVSSFPERAKLSYLLLSGFAEERWNVRALRA